MACAATRTFSSTLSCGNRFVIWNDFAMPRWAKRCCGSAVMSRPWNRMRPALGASEPEMRLKKVLLPAPFGPMIEVRLPEKKRAVTSASAVKPPKRLPSPSTSRIGAALTGSPSAVSEPQTPRGKNRIRSTNNVPTTSCQCTVTTVTTSCSRRRCSAPRKGPKKVPMPPSSVIISTTAEVK